MRSETAIALVVFAASTARAQERLGFADAVHRALVRNPTVVVASEEITRAQAIEEEVRAGWMPTLTANGAYTRLDADRRLNGNLIAGADQLNGNVTLAIPLIQARGWVQSAHARDNSRIARASAVEVRRQLAIAVARNYLSVIAARRVLEVSDRALTAAGAHYQFANQRFTSGYGSRLDQTRAAQEVATDRSQLERARSALFRLQESLGVLVGADHAIDAADEMPAVGEAPPDLATAQHDAEGLRADLKLERLRLDAAHRVSRDSWADYLPTLFGTFAPFLQNPPTLTVPQSGWQAQLVLQWSIFDGGLRYGQARERRALEREAAADLEGTLRQVGSDVRAADEEVRRAVAALEAAREAAREAQEAQELTATGYRAGASTNIEVIDAERTARDAATAVAQAEDAQRQAVLDLLIASGRFPGP